MCVCVCVFMSAWGMRKECGFRKCRKVHHLAQLLGQGVGGLCISRMELKQSWWDSLGWWVPASFTLWKSPLESLDPETIQGEQYKITKSRGPRRANSLELRKDHIFWCLNFSKQGCSKLRESLEVTVHLPGQMGTAVDWIGYRTRVKADANTLSHCLCNHTHLSDCGPPI